MKKLITITALTLGPLTSLDIKAEEEKIYNMERVTITANRTDKTLEELTNKVSVITSEEIDKKSHRDIKDLVRYEPGVTVSGIGRFGLSGFNIRGISGDRVLTLVDGAPLADEFSFGPALSARRNYIDVDALKAVEIVRGPASSLYGSNAIGGLVTFITKDPNDYFKNNIEKDYFSIKSSINSVDSSFDNTITYSTGNDKVQGMVIGTYRNGQETETYFTSDRSTGIARMSANPIDNRESNILGKIVFQSNENHGFKFTTEKYKADIDTQVLSQADMVVFGTVKQDVNSEDSRDRSRLSFEYTGTASTKLYDEVNFKFYHQDSESEQNTFENRLSPTQVTELRTRKSFYEHKNLGFKLNFIKDIETTIEQQWVYGIDFDRSKMKTLRLGQTINNNTGEQIPESSNFPTRDFPNSKYSSLGFFVQNELSFFEEKLMLVPSIRYDRFVLTPNVDDIYLSGNTGSPTPAAYTESEISSKLGAIYRFNDQWSIFGQFAEGFKAPPIDAVNTGFTNFAGGYTTLPNPNLVPESSKAKELGIRFKNDIHQLEISAYSTKYDNFIESLAFKGFNPATGLLEFQARNLDDAKIEGIEFRGYLDLNKLREGLHFQYAYAKSKGEDSSTNLPINTVQPTSFVAGIGYDSPNQKWGSEFIMTLNKRKTDIDDSAIQPNDPLLPAVDAFNTPGFSKFDWVGYYNLNENIKLNWAVFNLLDKQYWQWNDVLIQEASSSLLPRLTQPGRNASLTIKVEF